MKPKLYSIRNYFGVSTHYGLAGAVAAGAFIFAQPWAIVAAVGLTLPITALSLYANKKYMENYLVEHPKKHPDSPLLGHTVKTLFKASGLESKHYPVYDFRMRSDERPDKEKGALHGLFQTMLEKMAQTPNAAALNLGKPIIMISRPLLKLLNNEEEKAVLAHEFAHAAARHQHLKLPLGLVTTAAGIAAGLTVLGAAIGTGLLAFGGALFAGHVAGNIVRRSSPHNVLYGLPEEMLSLPDLHDKKKTERLAQKFGAAASIGTLAVFNPAYPVIWVTARAIRLTNAFTAASFSRANEYQADAGAVKLDASPLALITALRKISALSARSKQEAWDVGNSEGRPMPKPGFLTAVWARATASHPTVEQRAERLAGIARKQGYTEDAIDKALHAPVDISHAESIPYETIRFLTARLL